MSYTNIKNMSLKEGDTIIVSESGNGNVASGGKSIKLKVIKPMEIHYIEKHKESGGWDGYERYIVYNDYSYTIGNFCRSVPKALESYLKLY